MAFAWSLNGAQPLPSCSGLRGSKAYFGTTIRPNAHESDQRGKGQVRCAPAKSAWTSRHSLQRRDIRETIPDSLKEYITCSPTSVSNLNHSHRFPPQHHHIQRYIYSPWRPPLAQNQPHQSPPRHTSSPTLLQSLSNLHHLAKMVLEIILVGAAIYIIAHKVHDRKEKKRALKAQAASRHGPVVEVPIADDTGVSGQMEDLPAYQKEKLPAYQQIDEHPALGTNK